MKCKQARELMGVYLYGDLDPDEMRQLRLHTRNCAACREDLASRGRITSIIDDAAPKLDEDEKQRIMWSVSAAVDSPRTRRRPLWSRFAPALAMGGIFVVCVGIGMFIGMRMMTPRPAQPVAVGPPGPDRVASLSRPAAIGKHPAGAKHTLIPSKNQAPVQNLAKNTGSGRQNPLGAIIMRQMNDGQAIASRGIVHAYIRHRKHKKIWRSVPPAATLRANAAGLQTLPRTSGLRNAQR